MRFTRDTYPSSELKEARYRPLPYDAPDSVQHDACKPHALSEVSLGVKQSLVSAAGGKALNLATFATVAALELVRRIRRKKAGGNIFLFLC
jgi:hypothetical protein